MTLDLDRITNTEQKETIMTSTTPQTQAERSAHALNAYTGDNIWDDVILRLDGYDHDATEEADPDYGSDVVVFEDGSVIAWCEMTKLWSARG